MSKTIKEGDIITVESVSKSYQEHFDPDRVKIVSTDEELDGVRSLLDILDAQIFKVESHTPHKDFADYNLNIRQYTVRGIEVETTAKVNGGKTLKINGEYELDVKATGEARPLLKKFFANEERAKAVASVLNDLERERLVKLRGMCDKAITMFDQIVKEGYV